MSEIGVGDIAKCNRGYVGVITKTTKTETASVGETLYEGICLGGHRLGNPWQSKSPKKIGNMDEVVTELVKAS